ncbi:MAG TPA: Trm112 family protein [Acidimicrobiia bacterium]|nr:Trm112 family protein [Acidimicrobiia bacterium]
MALAPELLEILACPDDKGPLYYFEADGFLLCPACRRRYEVRDDIPVMLVDDAQVLSEDEAATLVERAQHEGVTPTFEAP